VDFLARFGSDFQFLLLCGNFRFHLSYHIRQQFFAYIAAMGSLSGTGFACTVLFTE